MKCKDRTIQYHYRYQDNYIALYTSLDIISMRLSSYLLGMPNIANASVSILYSNIGNNNNASSSNTQFSFNNPKPIRL
jgi:hypothetical protein